VTTFASFYSVIWKFSLAVRSPLAEESCSVIETIYQTQCACSYNSMLQTLQLNIQQVSSSYKVRMNAPHCAKIILVMPHNKLQRCRLFLENDSAES